jgi:hypothetical protein
MQMGVEGAEIVGADVLQFLLGEPSGSLGRRSQHGSTDQ